MKKPWFAIIWFGVWDVFHAGGGVSYALIYLFALSGFRGPTLLGDAMFLLFTLRVVASCACGSGWRVERDKAGNTWA